MLGLQSTGKSNLAQMCFTLYARLSETWAAEWTLKTEIWKHPPHKGVAAFGQYFGYTKVESKRLVRECFSTVAEVLAKGNADQLDPLSVYTDN
jgi:hypothetical protein